MHAIIGLLSISLTVVAACLALKTGGWVIRGSNMPIHSKVGFAALIMSVALGLGGMVANILRLKVPLDWNTKIMLRIGKVHRYFGWIVILFT